MARRSSVTGGAKLRRVLRKLPYEITAEVRAVVERGSQDILADALQRTPAPGRNPYSTGALKLKLRARLTKDGLTARIGSWGKRTRAGHAHLVEFGASAHDITMPDGGVIHHPGSPAQPFLLPAFRLNRRRIGTAIAAAIRRALAKANQL